MNNANNAFFWESIRFTRLIPTLTLTHSLTHSLTSLTHSLTHSLITHVVFEVWAEGQSRNAPRAAKEARDAGDDEKPNRAGATQNQGKQGRRKAQGRHPSCHG